jgi:hypothetical protein
MRMNSMTRTETAYVTTFTLHVASLTGQHGKGTAGIVSRSILFYTAASVEFNVNLRYAEICQSYSVQVLSHEDQTILDGK